MLNRLLNSLLAVAVVASMAGAWHLLDQPVQTLRIKSDLSEGERFQVEALLSRKELGGILSFDIEGLRETLMGMGWAREIYIRRQWPEVVEITLLREQPIARWGSDRFVTASSQLVALPDEYPGLPRFEVALSNPQQTLRVFSLVNRMVSSSQLELSQLKQNAHGEWQLIFARGFSVNLGVDRLAERIARFLQVYNAELISSEQEIAYIDVRYASGAAVKFVDAVDKSVLVASNP